MVEEMADDMILPPTEIVEEVVEMIVLKHDAQT